MDGRARPRRGTPLIAAWAEGPGGRARRPRSWCSLTPTTRWTKLNAALRAVCKQSRRARAGPPSSRPRRARLAFARGDRIQFTGTAKPRGILNGTAGRIADIRGNEIAVSLESGATLRFDATAFTQVSARLRLDAASQPGPQLRSNYLLYSKHWRAAAGYVWPCVTATSCVFPQSRAGARSADARAANETCG